MSAPPPLPPDVAPRRVLYVTDIYGGHHGGSEGQLVALVRALPAGWSPRLWVLQRSPWLFTEGFPAPVERLRLGSLANPFTWLRLLALVRRLRRERIDLIHTYHSDASLLLPLLGALAGVPVIVSRRDLGFWQSPRMQSALRLSGRFADLVLANAEAVKRAAVTAEHLAPQQIEVVANGHDPARFDAPADLALRAELGIPAEARLVGLLANLKPLKRQADLVTALSLIGKRFADAHVLFVGTGAGAEALRAQATSLGVGGRVHVHGVTGDVVPVLKLLSVGVLCSETEGLSNAILEYLGCGLPVVATDVGGNPELVREGENGFLVPVGHTQMLAERLTLLLGDEALRTRLAAGARASFDARYRLARMVAETTACYERVLAPPAPPPALTVEALTEHAAIAALEPAWRPLCGPWRFFSSPAWVLAWLEWAGAAARPVVLTVRDASGALVGLLPLCRGRGGRLHAVGHDLGADHLDVAATPVDALPAARAILRWFQRSRYRRLDLSHVAEEAALRVALRERGWRTAHAERAASVAPWIAAQGTFEGWLERTFDRKRRHELRRVTRRVRETEEAAVERIVSAAQVPAALRALFDLHARRFAEQGKSTVFQGARIEAFHTLLASRLLAEPQGEASALWLSILHRSGTPVAGFYGFRWAGILHHFQSGIDPAARALGPGTLLRLLTLEEDVFGQGLAAYDFMDGDEAYKLDWASGVRTLFDVVVDRPSLLGRARTLLRGATALAKGVVKRARARRTAQGKQAGCA